MSLRKITAIIRCTLLEPVERRLQEIGVPGMTVTHVKGFGEYANFFRRDWTVTHARIEIFTEQSLVDRIVDTIQDAAHTGTPGDGIVAVLPVERLYRIREKREISTHRSAAGLLP
jgi:nitrogen regulatory protein P-II 1